MRCLKVLLAGGVDVALVVTHQDSATENIWFESVHVAVRDRRHPLHHAGRRASRRNCWPQVQAAQPDLMFSFYYRHMLPQAILDVAPAYNMHGSLLPAYRGRAPTNWAVLHGARETGATLHEMTVKPDAGAIVAQTGRAHPARRYRLRSVRQGDGGGRTGAVRACCRRCWPGTAPRTPQRPDARAATSAAASRKTAASTGRSRRKQVYNLHRAVAPPYPGAFTDVGRRTAT